MTARAGLLLLAPALALLPPAARAQERMDVRVWPSQAGVANLPERRDCAFLAPGAADGQGRPCPADAGRLAARPSLGLAFSGGGTRSAAATVGELRGLAALGLLDKVRYVAAVSGGSWAAVPWTFAPASLSEADLLGRYTPPERIDAAGLADAGLTGRIAGAIAGARLAEPFLEAALRDARDEKYARALDEAFLRPVGLDGPDRLFALDRRQAADLAARNPWLDPARLRLAREDRPFLVALGALTTARGLRKSAWVPFEMTPLYVGAPALAGPGQRPPWGGGYVESFAYDSDLLARDAGGRAATAAWGRGGGPFSLSDVIGTSGAAPADIVDRLDLLGLLGFPRYRHWPAAGPDNATRGYNHGDGGFVDNLGIASLLARRVETILAFVNTVFPLCREGAARAGACTAPVLADEPAKVNDDLRQLFLGRANAPGRVVLEGGGAALQELVDALAAETAAGRPAVACREHRAVPNPYFAIAEAYPVRVCWFYLEWAQGWADRLPRGDATLRALARREDDFVRFPRYETFFENAVGRSFRDALRAMASVGERVMALRRALRHREGGKRVVQLRPEQIQALADFTAWSVCRAAADGRLALPAGLPGPADGCAPGGN